MKSNGRDRLGGLTPPRSGFVGALLCVVVASFASAQEDEGELLPGLAAKYTAGGKAVERVDRDVQFVWGSHSPDPRLPEATFEATWTGQVLVKPAGTYRLHAFVRGDVDVQLGGKPVLSARKTGEAGWADGSEVTLDSGEQPFQVTYRRGTEPEGTLRLFWSSESVPLEPLPPQAMFHTKPPSDAAAYERGQALYSHFRCGRCHVRPDEPAARSGPSLATAKRDLDAGWMATRLAQARDVPMAERVGNAMPDFGFTADEANALADFLKTREPADRLPQRPRNGDADKGRILFRSVGCVACHSHSGTGNKGPGTGGDLTHIADKRSVSWLGEWLKNPTALQPGTAMPAVRLDELELADLVAFLAASRGEPRRGKHVVRVDRGRDLFVAARCGACHITGNKDVDQLAAKSSGPALSRPEANVSSGCLSENPSRERHVPQYALTADDRAALQVFLKQRSGPLSKESPQARGEALLVEKNCLSCHDRDGTRGLSTMAAQLAGLDTALNGQSEALIPPDLTAVGDKLHDAALAQAIDGEQPTVRLPWLRVRMPRFRHSAEEKEQILAALIGHDRISDRSDRVIPTVPPPDPTKKEEPPGAKLLGSKGFNCASCHRVGAFEPRNTALGTRGSDLYRIGDRMRLPFFIRWTRSPLRIVPGMEMPSYEKPAKGILNEQLGPQLVAMWQSLNNPKAAPAVDGSTVEQILAVAPGEPPRIVRDVFRLGEVEPHTWVARSFVVGFDNGQNLLFDLDAASVRLWWAGDVARQRTLGKTWLWEPGAVALPPAGPLLPDIGFRESSSGRIVLPEREGPVTGRLLDYKPEGLNVTFRYQLRVRLSEKPDDVIVTERLRPDNVSKSGAQGWRRNIRVDSVPEGLSVLFLRTPGDAGFGRVGPVRSPGAPEWTSETIATALHNAAGADATVTVRREVLPLARENDGWQTHLMYRAVPSSSPSTVRPSKPETLPPEKLTVVPGYDAVRLPLDRSIMPTALTFRGDGTLAVCSLRGTVLLAKDTDSDGLEDRLEVFEEGLAAPYGLIADGNDLIASHKPELLRLKDTNGDGRADVRQVLAQGWGYTDNYHDWTCGIVRDSKGNLYVGLGSDYAHPTRDRTATRWRGSVLRISPEGKIERLGDGFRYPTGLAITPDDQVFVSDNQGVQNTFNEINHLVPGGHYGVPSLADDPKAQPVLAPAIQVPHPWTRSVNGLIFLPPNSGPFAGHGIGCEYDSRFLIRFSLQKVGDTYQGAAYAFSKPPPADERQGFLGTLCGAVSPKGDITIGSIYDSGWLGGPNVGDLVRLRANGNVPAGIREARAWTQGFELDFTTPMDRSVLEKPESYAISGYTREWKGAYATPDTGRHTVAVQKAEVLDGQHVRLTVDRLQPGYVYEITVRGTKDPLWPDTAHYTMNRVP